MPRESRKRGGSAHKRGLSLEQVCVPCAIDRKGHTQLEKTDLFLTKAVTVAISVKHRILSCSALVLILMQYFGSKEIG